MTRPCGLSMKTLRLTGHNGVISNLRKECIEPRRASMSPIRWTCVQKIETIGSIGRMPRRALISLA